MSITKFSTEIVLNINRYVDIGALDGACEQINGLSISSLNSERCNPHHYLRQLTPRTHDLLKYMQLTNTILSGSRAAGFFYPNATTSSSDWDFYSNNAERAIEFIYKLETLGVMWNVSPDPKHPYLYAYGEYDVLSGTWGEHRIQVITPSYGNALTCITEFHSTLVQCGMTGYCAFSMHHTLSFECKVKEWRVKDAASRISDSRTREEIRQKYEGRGYTYVPHAVGIRVRRMDDNHAKVIDFAPYLDLSSEIERSVAESYLDCIKITRWKEWHAHHMTANIERRYSSRSMVTQEKLAQMENSRATKFLVRFGTDRTYKFPSQWSVLCVRCSDDAVIKQEENKDNTISYTIERSEHRISRTHRCLLLSTGEIIEKPWLHMLKKINIWTVLLH